MIIELNKSCNSFRRDGASVTDPVLNDGTSEYTPGISQTSGAGTTFNASDRMGSNVLQTNSSQSSTSTTQYDAFGNLVSSTGSQAGPFGFNGQYGYQTDSDTNLQLLGHRYYDPTTGRFLTRDPIKAGNNWYDYVGNSPLRDVDPNGQNRIVDFFRSVWEDYSSVKDPNPPGEGLGVGTVAKAAAVLILGAIYYLASSTHRGPKLKDPIFNHFRMPSAPKPVFNGSGASAPDSYWNSRQRYMDPFKDDD